MSDAVPTDRPVTVQRDGPVVTLVLSRPERRNPLSHETMTELTERLRETGTIRRCGPSSSAPRGGLLRRPRPAWLATRDAAVHERVFAGLRRADADHPRAASAGHRPRPGIATAAGCQLVAACDLAVAARRAVRRPGVKIGLFCTTPMVELARVVGRTRAMEMLLTGEADRRPDRPGLRGSSTGSTPRAPRRRGRRARGARRLRERRDARDRQARRRQNLGLPLEEAYRHASGVMCRNAVTDDAQEGIAAFLEKRPPVWSR